MSIGLALLGGMAYGFFSVKGQFCMNSGFAQSATHRDFTKLKSYILAILAQIALFPVVAVLILEPLGGGPFAGILLPAFTLPALAIGGVIFGFSMKYAGGCAAGVFYKLGERNSGAIFAVAGFILGVFLTVRGMELLPKGLEKLLFFPAESLRGGNSLNMSWASALALLALLLIALLWRTGAAKPAGAVWSWRKTGLAIGALGILTWVSAIFERLPYGMSILAGIIDITNFSFLTWGALFLLGIPVGAFLAAFRKEGAAFAFPGFVPAAKKFAGGIGLGVGGIIAGGCTVGYGLGFLPFLSLTAFVGILFIYLGRVLAAIPEIQRSRA